MSFPMSCCHAVTELSALASTPFSVDAARRTSRARALADTIAAG